MREGKIEQVGTFDEIYEHPVNLFVAGFVGDPSMNLLPLTVGQKDNRLIMGEALYNIKIKVPLEWEQKLREKKMVGKDVVFGMRPEDIELGKASRSNNVFTFRARVEDREIGINKAHLFLKLGHFSLVASLENYKHLPLPGENAEFTFPVKRGKVFNKENGLAIIS